MSLDTGDSVGEPMNVRVGTEDVALTDDGHGVHRGTLACGFAIEVVQGVLDKPDAWTASVLVRNRHGDTTPLYVTYRSAQEAVDAVIGTLLRTLRANEDALRRQISSHVSELLSLREDIDRAQRLVSR